jgi:hypothetical protein
MRRAAAAAYALRHGAGGVVSPTMGSFPGGGAGLGLLLLRLAGGAALVALALAQAQGSSRGDWVLAGVSLVSGAAILVGLATRWAGTLGAASAATLVLLPQLETAATLGGRLPAFLLGAASAALALVGPGAFSLDARLFGRREIIIPQSSRTER